MKLGFVTGTADLTSMIPNHNAFEVVIMTFSRLIKAIHSCDKDPRAIRDKVLIHKDTQECRNNDSIIYSHLVSQLISPDEISYILMYHK